MIHLKEVRFSPPKIMSESFFEMVGTCIAEPMCVPVSRSYKILLKEHQLGVKVGEVEDQLWSNAIYFGLASDEHQVNWHRVGSLDTGSGWVNRVKLSI